MIKVNDDDDDDDDDGEEEEEEDNNNNMLNVCYILFCVLCAVCCSKLFLHDAI